MLRKGDLRMKMKIRVDPYQDLVWSSLPTTDSQLRQFREAYFRVAKKLYPDAELVEVEGYHARQTEEEAEQERKAWKEIHANCYRDSQGRWRTRRTCRANGSN